MDDKDKTKEELLNELAEMRLRIAEKTVLVIAGNETKKQLKFEQAQLLSICDSINEVVYVSDPDTYEILFVNKHVDTLFKNNVQGKICYKEFQGFDKPCDFCTNKIIKDLRGEPYQWQYHNPILGRDYDITDKIIKWHDGRDVRLELAIDITERKRSEETVLNIMKGLSGIVGEKFFNSLVKHMADMLETDYAYIAEIVPDRLNHVRTISFLAGGSFLKNIEVDLNGTPCEKVEGDRVCSFSAGIQKLFPQAVTMAQLGVDAYSGIELRDFSGKKIGLMAVMRKKPFDDIRTVEMVLKVFAVRASSELERSKTEEALIASERELSMNQVVLEQKNAALREMLLQIELEKNKLQKNIDSNITELIFPILQKLEGIGADSGLLSLLKNNLQGLTSSFGRQVSELNYRLTPKEIEICNMIINGLTSKDMGKLLNLSVQTINTHRKNIRKKLKLSNKKSNLASYLQSL